MPDVWLRELIDGGVAATVLSLDELRRGDFGSDCVAILLGASGIQQSDFLDRARLAAGQTPSVVFMVGAQSPADAATQTVRVDSANAGDLLQGIRHFIRSREPVGEWRPDVFLSYRRNERARIATLPSVITDSRYALWMDEYFLRPGVVWSSEIEDAIARCYVFLLVAHEYPPSDSYVWREVEIAKRHSRPVVVLSGQGGYERWRTAFQAIGPAFQGYLVRDRELSGDFKTLKLRSASGERANAPALRVTVFTHNGVPLVVVDDMLTFVPATGRAATENDGVQRGHYDERFLARSLVEMVLGNDLSEFDAPEWWMLDATARTPQTWPFGRKTNDPVARWGRLRSITEAERQSVPFELGKIRVRPQFDYAAYNNRPQSVRDRALAEHYASKRARYVDGQRLVDVLRDGS